MIVCGVCVVCVVCVCACVCVCWCVVCVLVCGVCVCVCVSVCVCDVCWCVCVCTYACLCVRVSVQGMWILESVWMCVQCASHTNEACDLHTKHVFTTAALAGWDHCCTVG